MKMNASFWKDKRVLITGYEGFLGSNLTKKLIDLNASVLGVDRRTRRPETILKKEDYQRMRVKTGDIANNSLISRIVNEFEPQVVFHLAAEAIVAVCNSDPIAAFKTNIEGTWNILENCRDKSFVRSIIVASSDKAYGSHRKLPYKETAALKGNHPYDVSKSCADLIALTYYNTYKTPVAVTRCGNIYGPGDFNFSRIIPDAIRCSLRNKTLEIRSDGRFTRDYVFVDDIVNGYMLIAEKFDEKNLAGEAFNFSDESPITVLKLIHNLNCIAERELRYVVRNSAKYEIKHQYLHSLKARRVLGWKPLHKLDTGLEKSYAWYKEIYGE